MVNLIEKLIELFVLCVSAFSLCVMGFLLYSMYDFYVKKEAHFWKDNPTFNRNVLEKLSADEQKALRLGWCDGLNSFSNRTSDQNLDNLLDVAKNKYPKVTLFSTMREISDKLTFKKDAKGPSIDRLIWSASKKLINEKIIVKEHTINKSETTDCVKDIRLIFDDTYQTDFSYLKILAEK